MFIKKYSLLFSFVLFFSSTSSFAGTCRASYQEQNFQSAKIQCLEEAHLNSSQAYYILGQLYANGHGVEKNINKAISYYHQAVLNNNIDAQIALGKYYKAQKHYLQSHIFYTLAFDNGSLISQTHKDKVEQYLSNNELELSKGYLDLVKDAIVQQEVERLALN